MDCTRLHEVCGRSSSPEGVVEVMEPDQNKSESWRDRIVIDPKILAGKPVVKGSRLAVEFVVDLLPQGWLEDAILSRGVWLVSCPTLP